MLQRCDLNSRDTKDMKNNMEARTYEHTHIVLARVQYEENRPAHLVLHTRDKQLKVRRMHKKTYRHRGARPATSDYWE